MREKRTQGTCHLRPFGARTVTRPTPAHAAGMARACTLHPLEHVFVSRRTPRFLALAATATVFGCPDTQIDRDGGAPTRDRSAAVRAGEADERELAHRLGAPDTSRLPVGRAPMPEEPHVSDRDPEDAAPEVVPSVIEGVALGDMASFERKLREELAAADLALTATIDLRGEPPSRLFVVTPVAPVVARHLASPVAEAALEHARLVVAYADPDAADRVHIAYLSPQRRAGGGSAQGQYDARVAAAIHRAADRTD